MAFRGEASMRLLRAGCVADALPASQNPHTVSPAPSGIEMPPPAPIPRGRGTRRVEPMTGSAACPSVGQGGAGGSSLPYGTDFGRDDSLSRPRMTQPSSPNGYAEPWRLIPTNRLPGSGYAGSGRKEQAPGKNAVHYCNSCRMQHTYLLPESAEPG